MTRPPRGLRRAARVLFWIVLAFIAFATLSPIADRPETGFPPWVERFAAFAVLSGLAALAYPRRRLVWIAALVALAGLLEAGQELQPGRHGRMIDFDVKSAGVVAGYVAALVVSSLAGRRESTAPSVSALTNPHDASRRSEGS